MAYKQGHGVGEDNRREAEVKEGGRAEQSEALKRQAPAFPRAFQKDQPCSHTDFSPTTLTRTHSFQREYKPAVSAACLTDLGSRLQQAPYYLLHSAARIRDSRVPTPPPPSLPLSLPRPLLHVFNVPRCSLLSGQPTHCVPLPSLVSLWVWPHSQDSVLTHYVKSEAWCPTPNT